MKPILPILIISLVSFLESCGECQPDIQVWNSEQQKLKTVVDLYESKDLLFGTSNARVERVIPDSLRIIDFDTLIYVNNGSRTDINDGTFTVRFYKLDKGKERIKEVVYTTQVSQLKELNDTKCCFKVAPNWYVQNL